MGDVIEALIAGPRQTVDIVVHPQRGRGVLVHRHGPTFFRPEGGAPVRVRQVSHGARARTGPYAVLADPKHGRVEVKVECPGEHHNRMWHPIFGAGWLVMERGDEWWIRFEPDEGRPIRFEWRQIAAGTPDYVRRSDRCKSKVIEMTPEEELWRTYATTDGETIAFREGGPPPEPTTELGPRQLALPGAEAGQ